MSDSMTSTIATHKLHIIPIFASMLICSFSFDLSADTPRIRVSVQAQGLDNDDALMLGALSREFRKLDGVVVTDTQPTLTIMCLAMRLTEHGGRVATGYASCVAVTGEGDRFVTHLIQSSHTIDDLARAIAGRLDGSVIEE